MFWLRHLSICLVLVAAFDVGAAAHDQKTPVVQLKYGKLQGHVKAVPNEAQKVYAYEGIQFGEAKRFEKPTEVKPWQRTYEATYTRYDCPPEKHIVDHHDESLSKEQCLYLNIFRPADNRTDRSVLVWIHGGGYQGGTNKVDGRYASLHGDVVLVSINYRLAAFGFLYGATADHPGNLGFYDQVLALHWIRENIEHFGGNPNDVTLMGESAGAFSIGALILSPLAEGLFHRAIMQSGAVNSPNHYRSREESLNRTRECGRLVNCEHEDLKAMFKCMHTKVTVDIEMCDHYAFEPTYGTEFLPLHPVQHLKQNLTKKVDLLIGVSSNEGIAFQLPHIKEWTTKHHNKLTVDGVRHLISPWTRFAGAKQEDAAKIVDYYTKHLSDNSSFIELRNAVGDAYGDFLIVCPAVYFAEAMGKHLKGSGHRVYAYQFMQVLERPGCTRDMGVCHSTINLYDFGAPLAHAGDSHSIYHADDVTLAKEIMKVNGEFARTGQLTSMVGGHNWTEAFSHGDGQTIDYFQLKHNSTGMSSGLFRERCNLWRNVIFDTRA